MKVWAKAIYGIAAFILFAPEDSAGLRAEVTWKLGVDCVDSPSNWYDSDGDECKDYRRNDWCGAFRNESKTFITKKIRRERNYFYQEISNGSRLK